MDYKADILQCILPTMYSIHTQINVVVFDSTELENKVYLHCLLREAVVATLQVV